MEQIYKIYNEMIDSQNKKSLIKESAGDKVYVLGYTDSGTTTIKGVFESKEKAEETLKYLAANPQSNDEGESDKYEESNFEISEFEINSVKK